LLCGKHRTHDLVMDLADIEATALGRPSPHRSSKGKNKGGHFHPPPSSLLHKTRENALLRVASEAINTKILSTTPVWADEARERGGDRFGAEWNACWTWFGTLSLKEQETVLTWADDEQLSDFLLDLQCVSSDRAATEEGAFFAVTDSLSVLKLNTTVKHRKSGSDFCSSSGKHRKSVSEKAKGAPATERVLYKEWSSAGMTGGHSAEDAHRHQKHKYPLDLLSENTRASCRELSKHVHLCFRKTSGKTSGDGRGSAMVGLRYGCERTENKMLQVAYVPVLASCFVSPSHAYF
jgi:hypothetical protein